MIRRSLPARLLAGLCCAWLPGFLVPLAPATALRVPASGYSPEDTHIEVELEVTDPDGLRSTAAVHLEPVVSVLRIDTRPSGIPIFLDGEPSSTPRVYASFERFVHQVEAQASYELDGAALEFRCWSDGGERAHAFTAPEGGAELTAGYAPAGGPCPFDARGSWKRCDHNCDGRQDLSDAVAGLVSLFLGGPVTCCPPAADCNSDAREDISDWIYLLAHLFLGIPEPEPPYRGCGKAEGADCLEHAACAGG